MGSSDQELFSSRPSERRRHPRVPVMQRSSVFQTRRPLSAVLVDVSREGARIATRFPREAGTVLGVRLEAEGRAMCLPLRLLWDRPVDGGFELGGSFDALTEEERAHLDRFLRSTALVGVH